MRGKEGKQNSGQEEKTNKQLDEVGNTEAEYRLTNQKKICENLATLYCRPHLVTLRVSDAERKQYGVSLRHRLNLSDPQIR